MKLELIIEGEPAQAEFTSANGIVQLRYNGQMHEAWVSEPEPGLFLVIINGRVYRCALERSSTGETEVVVNNRRISIAVSDKKHLRHHTGAAAGGGGPTGLRSPMPGKVVRILLNPGDQVAAHQGVLVVEAMKMQNEIQSPRAGKVLEINVSEGQTVNVGQTLARVE
ncbi:MAG: biotin/lipoyl-binding protein [Acidobacteria bacterium]|nr:biotin/lipoyl-binding protein [Acidobacteriota bacterium]